MLFELNEYIEGFEIHRNHLSIDRQIAILSACRSVLKANPLWRPKFAGKGFVSDYALTNTNCGEFGWIADEKGFRYQTKDIHGNPFQPVPVEIMEVVREFTPKSYRAENCLINFYQDRTIDGKPKKSKLGLHQDRTEKDLTAPIVSISLGQAAVFQIGGLEKADPVSEIEVVSGDVIVMAGKSRNAFHGVKGLLPGTCPKELEIKTESRINITIRQVNPIPKEFERIQQRNDFQRSNPASEIVRLERKMIDRHFRIDFQLSPAHALTPEERLVYADFLLNVKNDVKGSEVFRKYVEPIDEEIKERRKR